MNRKPPVLESLFHKVHQLTEMCGVPQGSMLGPMLFNLYVTGMSTFTSGMCLQFTDDTTLYKKCKVKDIPDRANIIQNVEHLKPWSDVNSLVLKEQKLRPWMSQYPHLDKADTYSVVLDGNEAESRKNTLC